MAHSKEKARNNPENSTKISEACDRMHDYVLDCKPQDENEDSPEDKPEIHAMPGSPLGWRAYLPAIEDVRSLPGILLTRDTVRGIKSLQKDYSTQRINWRGGHLN
jgi:hypothetical protein